MGFDCKTKVASRTSYVHESSYKCLSGVQSWSSRERDVLKTDHYFYSLAQEILDQLEYKGGSWPKD